MKNIVLFSVVSAIFAVSSTVVASDAPITFSASLSKISDQEKAVLTSYIGHATKAAEALTSEKLAELCAESPERFAWQEFPSISGLLDAFELTGDTKYLDDFKKAFSLFQGLLKKADDGFLGWQGKPIPSRRLTDNPDLQIDELQCNFRATGILARWVNLARSNKTYAEDNKETISAYLELMEKHLFPKWDERKFYVNLEKVGSVYRGLDYPLANAEKPGFTLSHEKISILVEGLLNLHRASGNDLYLRRAVELGTRFKHCLRIVDGHYEWMSWEPAGRWDINPDKPDAWKIGWIAPDPKAEWYMTSASIAILLYQHGLVFNDEDLAFFVATQKKRCWNGSFETPEYRTVGGVSGAENKFVTGRFLSHLVSLYDADLSKLAFDGPHEAEVVTNSTHPWKGSVVLSQYVRAKYLVQPLVKAQKQPFAATGQAFLDKKENKDFYEKLRFSVATAPAHIVPLKPSDLW